MWILRPSCVITIQLIISEILVPEVGVEPTGLTPLWWFFNLMNCLQACSEEHWCSTRGSVQQTLSEQIELSASVHRALDELELVDPALSLALAVG